MTFAQTPSFGAEEQLVVKLINDYRAQNGLAPLRVSVALTQASKWLSNDMATKNYFNHTDSLGRDAITRMTAFGYTHPGGRGENIAAGYSDAARTFNLWRESPGHNAAMLNPGFNVIGVGRGYHNSSLYRWYWTTDFGSFVDATVEIGGDTTLSLRVVNAANYAPMLAPDTLSAAFGNQLCTATMSALSLPLPNSMAGVVVTVNGTQAQLLYISPTQINYLVPSNISPGLAVVRVLNNGNVTATGTVTVETVSPSIFTALASGKGIAAAQTTADGIAFQSIAYADGIARPVSVGTATKPNYLVLYGTGIRQRSTLANVRITIGGVAANAEFAGAHSRLAGLDQINVKLPQELRGRGEVDVIVTVDGRAANVVKINIGQ